MQGFIDVIRKIVVMVLLLELVIQLQPGKHYEPYLKLFVGIFMLYSLFSGISNSVFQDELWKKWPIYEFEWTSEIEEEQLNEIEKKEVLVEDIEIEKIEIERVGQIP